MNLTKTTASLINKDQIGEFWHQWMWQQKNAINTTDQLFEIFPGIPETTKDNIRLNIGLRRLRITLYTLSMIQCTENGLTPVFDDPIWRQLVPSWKGEGNTNYSYDGQTENWEMPHEMVTPIAQHKYNNRVIIRLSNVCHGYCQFCYESLRTLEKKSSKPPLQKDHWKSTIDYIRSNQEIEEVILSGGEPLMHSNERLEQVLADIRNIGRPIAIRIHTRALTFNPFRITPDLIQLLRRYQVTAIGIHIAHPNEITPELFAGVERLRTGTPILFANIPLLKGINDNIKTMRALCMELYSIGIIPHYLYHFMPFSPGSTEFRTSVQAGVDIVSFLKRRISNLAVPEFVLPHSSGKHTMPLLATDQPPAYASINSNGDPIIQYTNWQGKKVEYPDSVA